MLLHFSLILSALPAVLCFRLELPSESAAIATDSFTVSWHLEEDDDANGELEINLEYLVIDGETNTLISTTSKVDATESSTVLPPSFLPAVRPSETIPIGMLMHAIKDGQWTDPHARKIFLVGRTQEPDTITITAPATMAAGETTTAGTDIALKTPAPNNVSEEANEVQEDEAGSRGLSTGAKAGVGTGVGAAVVLFIAAVWVYLTRLRSEVAAPGVEKDDSDIPELETREWRVLELESTNKSTGLPVQVMPAAESQPRERYELSG